MGSVVLMALKFGPKTPYNTGNTANPGKTRFSAEPHALRKVIAENSSNANAHAQETDALISARYAENMKKWKDTVFPPGVEVEFKRFEMECARIFVSNPASLNAYVEKAWPQQIKIGNKTEAWMSTASLKSYLSEADGLSAKHHVLAAYLSTDPTIISEAAQKYPDDPDLAFYGLVFNDNYLNNPEGIRKFAALQPDSPWPQIMGALAGMQGGDSASAAAFLKQALGAEIQPFEHGYEEAWSQLEAALKADPATKLPDWPKDINSLRFKSSDDLLQGIILGAPDFYKQHPGDPDAIAFTGAALSLAERYSESGSLVGERVALMNELDILTALGAEAAQPYMSVPYQELVDSLHSRRETLKNQIDTVSAFSKKLSSGAKAEFEALSQQNGDWKAYEAMKTK